MKTVEIVKTAKGEFITRRYCGQNKGREFFYSVAPDSVKTKKREFLKTEQEKKEKYIKDWTDE